MEEVRKVNVSEMSRPFTQIEPTGEQLAVASSEHKSVRHSRYIRKPLVEPELDVTHVGKQGRKLLHKMQFKNGMPLSSNYKIISNKSHVKLRDSSDEGARPVTPILDFKRKGTELKAKSG